MELLSKNIKELSKIPIFSFNGIKTIARVIKVYDGDTLTIVFPFNDNIIKCSCRLLGIDTPEIRSKNKKEKEYAIKARNRIRELTIKEDKYIYVIFGKNDKYGRPLISAFLDEEYKINIAKILLDENYGKVYWGGKKEKWTFD